MPLFSYSCKSCGAYSEVLVRGSETPACPECGSAKLEKQMSLFAAMSGPSTEPACGSCDESVHQGGGCAMGGGCGCCH